MEQPDNPRIPTLALLSNCWKMSEHKVCRYEVSINFGLIAGTCIEELPLVGVNPDDLRNRVVASYRI